MPSQMPFLAGLNGLRQLSRNEGIMASTFVVRKDDTIDIMTGITDGDIMEIYESLSAYVVFRIVGKTVEFADAVSRTEGIIWKKAHKV